MSTTPTDEALRDPLARRAFDRRMIQVGAVVVLGSLIAVLDVTIVYVATRAIGRDLGGSISSVQWVLTGYMLAFAGIIPVTGWAIDRFGAKRVWIGALLVFMGASVLCGLAWSSGTLIAFRILQGIGGGMITPVGDALIVQAAGPWRLGRVMSILGAPTLVGSVAGPVLGGLIVSSIGWRWIFLINVPLCIVAVLTAMWLLPRTSSGPRARLDLRGLVLLTFGVAVFIYGMSETGGTGGFGGIRGSVELGVGTLLLALYGLHARALRGRALIDLSLFRKRGFAAPAVLNLLFPVAMFGALLLFPLYWQIAAGQSPFATGVVMASLAFGSMVVLPLAGRLTDTVGAGLVVPGGVVLALLGLFVYAQAGVHASRPVLVGALFVLGLGVGATNMPLTAAAYASLPRDVIPRAASALNTIKRLGASIGTAVMAVVLQRAIVSEVPQLGDAALRPLAPETRAGFASGLAHAFSETFWLAFALTAIALGPALYLPRNWRRRPRG
ncbi:MAG TPA: MDR family MFS transporter [Streptosporangiaceae bacterium]